MIYSMFLFETICFLIAMVIIIAPIFFNGFLIFYLIKAHKSKRNVFNIILGLIVTYIFFKIYFSYAIEAIETENIFYLCSLFLPLVIILYFPIKYKLKNIILRKKNQKKYEYYREVPNNLDVILNSYLYFGKLEIENILLAFVIEFTNKGYLIVKDNYVAINVKKDDKTLTNIEKYILNSIRFKEKIKERKLIYYLDLDLAKNDLIEPRKSLFKDIIIVILLLFILFIVFYKNYFSFIFVGTIFSVIMFCIYYMVNAFDFNYTYTKKGFEEYAKIHALKRFLKEFSVIKERKIEEYEIWEEFLSYAIALKINIKNNKYIKEHYSHVYSTKIDYSYGLFESIGNFVKSIIKK